LRKQLQNETTFSRLNFQLWEFFKCNFTFSKHKKRFNCFYGVKRSTNASINHFSQKERWMPILRQQKERWMPLRQQNSSSAV
jgi:hypothetical protein